jgi:hypothetical protein
LPAPSALRRSESTASSTVPPGASPHPGMHTRKDSYRHRTARPHVGPVDGILPIVLARLSDIEGATDRQATHRSQPFRSERSSSENAEPLGHRSARRPWPIALAQARNPDRRAKATPV